MDEQAQAKAPGHQHELQADPATDGEFEAGLGDAGKDDGESFIDLSGDL
jgi:hypothetical protein